MKRTLTITADVDTPALTMTRSKHWCDRLVYVICGNRRQRYDRHRKKYKDGGSRILYIGVTEMGKRRPSSSMARVSDRAFTELHGIRTIRVYLVKCGMRRHVQTWRQLESALLTTFRERFGYLPVFNKISGTKPQKRKLFAPKRLITLIDELS